jgi:pimeloyl-ACP methyl ester carboxylesterase
VTSRYVVFSHGLEGSPQGVKITALADTARSEGYKTVAVDYRGIDSVPARITKLVDACKDCRGELVLVGSSLGGYLSVATASLLHARGLFLMAPALYLDQLPPLKSGVIECPVTIVHGLHDDVVPFANSIRFAQEYRAALHLLQSDHLLHDQIRALKYLFEYFLIGLGLPQPIG